MAAGRRHKSGSVIGALIAGFAITCVMFLTLLGAVGGLTGNASLGTACGPKLTVGATEYGGPGDPSSGSVGSSGVSLPQQPASFAELGGTSFSTANALGGLPYGTPLQITAGRRTVVAYKEDIGLGGGPIAGRQRVIDLWWQLARRLGIPYEDGRWSGTVKIEPLAGACAQVDATSPVAAGPRATLLPDGAAAAPVSAPAAVRGIIAAGNQIIGRPYVYGGAHGLPLSVVAPYYDCSSSVAHLLYGGGLLAVGDDMVSGDFETWGLPGAGRWVTIYASPSHVYMYVAGMRWDTHDAAGPGDGTNGIGWHPLVRSGAGFVVRHPAGL